MGLSKKRDRVDPHRRRLSPVGFVERDQRIWTMRAEGYTFQEIADAVGCGLATVDRALKRLAARMTSEDEDDVQADEALARYDDQSMHCADVRTAEDVRRLNDLELYRMSFLPAGHPAFTAMEEAYAQGWRWPVSPKPTYPVGDTTLDWAGRADW
jgi:hypothetical protein